MPIIAPSKSKKEYDVIVVGSGAGGGMTAYMLAVNGLKVLMLEAGRNYDPVTETPMFNTPDQAPLRGTSTVDKPFGFYDSTVDGGWQVPGEPYTSHPGTNFKWWRSRMLGGRTNHWGRISLRLGEYDFKPRSRDGLGIDWPIDYDDLAPYYDRTEMLAGIYGGNKPYENTPASSPGVLMPPPAARGYELLTKKHCAPLGIPVIPCHRAVLTRKQNHKTLPQKIHPGNPLAQKVLAQSMASRQQCFFATACGRGCSIKANFQSTTVLIPPALATGNVDIIPNAMVREVIMKNGKAHGVSYVDKVTRTDRSVRARAVVLSASGCESARILLNSRGGKGVGNSSGLVGRYLMDTVGARLSGHIPALENTPRHNEDGDTGTARYMPWWLYKEQNAGKLDFARGYHIEFGGGMRMPSLGTASGLQRFNGGTYGKALKEDARRYYGSFIGFSGRGEMIPNDNSYCEIDPEKVDQWGIPVLRFHWKWSSHELNQARHMQRTFAEIIESMGGTITSPYHSDDGAKSIYDPGAIIHEVGTTCMGANAKESVLNQFCQSWEVPNLFVNDGGCFASNADKNPTLTILAVAMRSSEYLVAEAKKGNI